jgi:hypothetical protein
MKERKILKETKGRLRKTITTIVTTTLLFHIWGENGGLAHVASKGLSILRYSATIQKNIYFKRLKAS